MQAMSSSGYGAARAHERLGYYMAPTAQLAQRRPVAATHTKALNFYYHLYGSGMGTLQERRTARIGRAVPGQRWRRDLASRRCRSEWVGPHAGYSDYD